MVRPQYKRIIHHEFGHTRFFSRHSQDPGIPVTLRDERLVVIYNDNPVRMLNGNEPRYTYKLNRRTINVITGKEAPFGEDTVREDDPRVPIKTGLPGAYRK